MFELLSITFVKALSTINMINQNEPFNQDVSENNIHLNAHGNYFSSIVNCLSFSADGGRV